MVARRQLTSSACVTTCTLVLLLAGLAFAQQPVAPNLSLDMTSVLPAWIPSNQPPTVSILGIQEVGDDWLVAGIVIDSDGIPSGLSVWIWTENVLATTTTGFGGEFQLLIRKSNAPSGSFALAYAFDDHELASPGVLVSFDSTPLNPFGSAYMQGMTYP